MTIQIFIKKFMSLKFREKSSMNFLNNADLSLESLLENFTIEYLRLQSQNKEAKQIHW